MVLKRLVVYFSRTGNCCWFAQTVAAEIGADVEELVEVKSRLGVLSSLWERFNAARWKTEIAPTTRSTADYDLIIIGTPVWRGLPAPAIMTFLKKTDLSGKKVAIFFTQGNKKTQAVEETKALLQNSIYLGELSLVNPLDNKEESEKQIVAWCAKLLKLISA